jgi:Flp pilus assembly protein TadG
VELAVLLPFLLFLAVIATDWARQLYYTIVLENAARSGALYACDQISQSQSPYSNVTDAALSEAPNLPLTPTVTQTNLVDGGDGQPAVVVTVSVTFNTITNFSYPSWFGVPNSVPLSRSVQMRVAPVVTN